LRLDGNAVVDRRTLLLHHLPGLAFVFAQLTVLRIPFQSAKGLVGSTDLLVNYL
jgi:hypothetical protein